MPLASTRVSGRCRHIDQNLCFVFATELKGPAWKVWWRLVVIKHTAHIVKLIPVFWCPRHNILWQNMATCVQMFKCPQRFGSHAWRDYGAEARLSLNLIKASDPLHSDLCERPCSTVMKDEKVCTMFHTDWWRWLDGGTKTHSACQSLYLLT